MNPSVSYQYLLCFELSWYMFISVYMYLILLSLYMNSFVFMCWILFVVVNVNISMNMNLMGIIELFVHTELRPPLWVGIRVRYFKTYALPKTNSGYVVLRGIICLYLWLLYRIYIVPSIIRHQIFCVC